MQTPFRQSVLAVLVAGGEEELQPEADAEERLAGTDVLGDRLHEPGLAQPGDGVAEGADARQHELGGRADALPQLTATCEDLGGRRGAVPQMHDVDAAAHCRLDSRHRCRAVGDQMQPTDAYSITPSAMLSRVGGS